MPIWPNFQVNGLDWQCCLAGSSKMAPRILVFSISMCADYSLYVFSCPHIFWVYFFSLSLCVQTMTKKVNTLKCAGQAHLLKGPVSFLYQSNFCSKPNQVKGEKIVLFKMTESNQFCYAKSWWVIKNFVQPRQHTILSASHSVQI